MAKKKTIRTIPQARTPMPEQAPELRVKNFDEVACGYRLEMHWSRPNVAWTAPTSPACAAARSASTSRFIQKMAAKNFHGAYDVITDTNLLPSVCGRVCRRRTSAKACAPSARRWRPVAIGRLERFVGDMAIAEGWANIPTSSATASRSASSAPVRPAWPVRPTWPRRAATSRCSRPSTSPAGSEVRHPDFRLPNSVVDVEIEKLTRLGIRFECNTLVGRLFTLEQMLGEMGYHAVFVGTGAVIRASWASPASRWRRAVGQRVADPLQPDARARLPEIRHAAAARQRVAVIGAGNTAMDAMRVSLRVGAEKVYCIYRRSAAEAPARAEEIHHAQQEGIEFQWLTSPLELLGDAAKNVRAMRCERMELGEPDARAGAARYRWPAAPSRSRPTWWCSRSAPTPIRSSARRPA